MAVTWGILLGILGKGVPPSSLNPDPTSDQNVHAIPHNRFQTWSLKSIFEPRYLDQLKTTYRFRIFYST